MKRLLELIGWRSDSPNAVPLFSTSPWAAAGLGLIAVICVIVWKMI